MGVALELLQVIGEVVAKNAVKGVVNAFTFGVGGDVLTEIWERWRQASSEKQRTADVQALASAPPAEVAAAAAKIVQQEAGHLSDADKEILAAYLRQVPAMIHQSQRRPADPEGKTILQGTTFNRPEDLLPLLPPQPPRFMPGDEPPEIGGLKLVELLGRGGFGEVWLAREPHLSNVPPVALKFCLDAEAAKALRNEVRLLDHVQSLGNHTGIVRLLRTHLRATPPCLEYEYIRGGDLASWIRERGAKACLGPMSACNVIQRLAEIVGYAHRLNPPIVHRDLKPANILVPARLDRKLELKITDFGIGGLAIEGVRDESRRLSHSEFLTTAARGACTLLYASPQQKKGDNPHPSDDVHALGVMWYQLLVGDVTAELPRGAAWQKRLAERGVTAPMLELLIACCSSERDERPTDGVDLARRLAPLNAAPGPTPPPETPKPFPKSPNSVGMWFELIRSGTFLMGSPESETGRQACEGPRRGLTISRPFYLGVHPVTQRQYEAVMGHNPSLYAGNPGHPVERVGWDDAVEFCARLSAMPSEKEAGRVYRLPTEAEWEFACRAGTVTPFHFGAAASSNKANFDGRHPYGGATKGPALQRTSAVGSFEKNAWGLFDMHGNVREWCSDWFAEDYYRRRENTDPQGPPTGERRALRGGSWGSKGKNCRAAFREGGDPGNRNNAGYGFRVVCVSASGTPQHMT